MASSPQRMPGSRLLVAAAVVVLAVVLIPTLIPSLNPFKTETKDRSQPALLKSLRRISEYRAASANLQQVVDVEEDASLLPSFVKGRRALIVVGGSVDASVDFSALGAGALKVSDDRRTVAIELPAARLTPARVDLAQTRVVDSDRGVIDRVGDALGNGGADDERKLLLLAQRKLDTAAAADPNLRKAAERNTAAMLERLCEGLGFDHVTVRFKQPAV